MAVVKKIVKKTKGKTVASRDVARDLAKKGVAGARAQAAEGEAPGRRLTVEKKVAKRAKRWASVQQKGLIKVTRPQALKAGSARQFDVGGPNKGGIRKSFVTEKAPSKGELQRQKHAGRGEFHAKKAARRAGPAPKAPKPITAPKPAGGLAAKAGRVLGKVAGRGFEKAIVKHTPEILKYKPMKTFHTAGAVKGAGVKAAAWQGAKRVAPGAAAGVALGTAIGGKKGAATGAVLGGAVSAVLPRVASRAALPLAAGMGAVDIYRAGKQVRKGYKAAKHVKTHARAAKKAGYKVTRRHPVIGMLTGDPGIKITKAKKKK